MFRLSQGKFFLLFCLCACNGWQKFWQPGKTITSYEIPAINAKGFIFGNNITVLAPTLMSLTPQIATFTFIGDKITVDGALQVSGVTENPYASVLKYTVSAGDGSSQDYYVSLLSPRMLAGSSLRLWLRADSLALTHGSQIGTWNDESGQNNHMSQATGVQRPIFHTGVIHGNPAAFFSDAANTTIMGPDTNINDPSNGSFFIVFSITAHTSARILVLLHGAQGRTFDLAEPNQTRFQQGRNGIGWNYVSSFDFGLNNFIAIGSVQVATSSVNEIWNGDEKGSAAPTCCSSYDLTGSGSNTNSISNGNFEGYVAEMMYFDAAISQADSDRVFCYLNTKYGLLSVRKVCES